MSGSEGRERPAWEALVTLAGAATGIVIFVYLVGGAIVWERLHVLRLPANHGVAALPRELLLVVGVRALAWPLALGLLAIGLVLSLGRVPRPLTARARGLHAACCGSTSCRSSCRGST